MRPRLGSPQAPPPVPSRLGDPLHPAELGGLEPPLPVAQRLEKPRSVVVAPRNLGRDRCHPQLIREETLGQLQRGPSVSFPALPLRHHQPSQGRRHFVRARLELDRADQALRVGAPDRQVVASVLRQRLLVHHLHGRGIEVGGAGQRLEVIGRVEVHLPDRREVLGPRRFQIDQRAIDSRVRAGAHRIRIAFSTLALPWDVSSIRYTPAGAARPAASRPFHGKAYTPATPGPSCNVRTSVPSTRYTRSANRPSRSMETGILASGWNGFGRTDPRESTRGADEDTGIVTSTGPYSASGAPSRGTRTQ